MIKILIWSKRKKILFLKDKNKNTQIRKSNRILNGKKLSSVIFMQKNTKWDSISTHKDGRLNISEQDPTTLIFNFFNIFFKKKYWSCALKIFNFFLSFKLFFSYVFVYPSDLKKSLASRHDKSLPFKAIPEKIEIF